MEPESKEGEKSRNTETVIKISKACEAGEGGRGGGGALNSSGFSKFKTVSHFHITALSSFCVESARNGKVTK